jgi:hypothetical protein
MFRSVFLALVLAAASITSTPMAFAAGGANGAGANPTLVTIPSISASISRNYRAVGMMVVDIGLDVPDAALRGRVAASMPRLRDAYRTAIADYSANRYEFQTVPDADTIARILQAATDRTLGVGGARVLLSSIMVQRGR